MTSEPAKVSRFFLDFMDSVNLKNHDSIIMKAHATAADDTCLELDVRLHATHPTLKYMVALIDENATADHPATGEAVAKADAFIDMLRFPEDTPKLDNYYLGPFTEDQILEILEAADITSARLDKDKHIECLQKQIEFLQKQSDSFASHSRIHGGMLSALGNMERLQKREERKGMFTVLEGGKSAAPKLA